MAEAGRGRFLRLVKGQSSEPVQPDALAPVARAAHEGDPAAVRTFLITIGPHLQRVVRRVLGTTHPDVDDVVQESAFGVMDALPRRRGDSTVLHFACRIAVLVAMKHRRREAAQKRAAVRDDGLDIDLFPGDGAEADAEVASRAITHVLRQLLDSLPIDQAEVIALHCVLGYTIAEIAATSGAPRETVRSRLRLAKQAMRERILGNSRLEELVGRSW